MQPSQSDSEWVQQAKHGSSEAFSVLVEKYRQKVFQTAMGFLHNTDDAEDLTQDIFVKVWKSLGSFDQRSAFTTWLYRIAVNMAINVVRKNKIRSFIGINDEVNESNYANNNADDNLIRREQKAEIRRAMDKLKASQKKAFVLFYYQELNMKEVADVLNMSLKAAESLVFRARKSLQKELSR
jgi:RNA polymerase sigma-70 factor (ECF subfamily)